MPKQRQQPATPLQAPQEAPEQPVEPQVDLSEYAGTLVGADGNPIAVPAGDLADLLAAGGERLLAGIEMVADGEMHEVTLEAGVPPLELGEALGGGLPPQGNEKELEPQPKGPHTIVGPNGTITQVFE